MSDLICRNTMTRCPTPGMCAPHGGCRVSVLTNANVRYSTSSAPLTTIPDTIELFPGVQFRKDTTKPLGNQWMFEHEGSWLIAKLAYCDDISIDHLAKVTRERDALLVEIRQLRQAAPPHDDIPDFGGGGNKARRRAATLGIDMDSSLKAGSPVPVPRPWKEVAEPVADADRKCHEADCWNCEGTGRDPNGGICKMNDDFPF